MNNAYIVIKRNDLGLKIGTRLELTEDGFEQIIMDKDPVTGRFQAMGYTGLVLPPAQVSEFVAQIKSNGVDDNAFIPGANKRTRSYSE